MCSMSIEQNSNAKVVDFGFGPIFCEIFHALLELVVILTI